MTTCTAGCHAKIASIFGLKTREPLFKKTTNIAKHFDYGRLVFQKFNHATILPRKRPEMFFPVGVGQTAHVKYIVGVGGGNLLVFEKKGGDGEGAHRGGW